MDIVRRPSASWLRLARTGSFGMLVLLLAQFLTGMVVNIYVKVSDSHPGTSASYAAGFWPGVQWAITQGGPGLAIHTALGLGLLAAALGFVVAAVASRQGLWITASAVALVGIASAGFNGVGFLNYGPDISTFLMASGFALATASYLVVLFALREPSAHFSQDRQFD